MILTPSLLSSLAEVCVTFTGFIGILLAIGGRSKEHWTPSDNARFWTMILNCLTPVALCLLPLLLGPESFRIIGLVVGGIWAVLLIRQAVSVIGVPGASSKVTAFIITTTVVIYGQFIASAMALIGVTVQQSYLTLIFWNLTVAALFFVRALRSMSPVD